MEYFKDESAYLKVEEDKFTEPANPLNIQLNSIQLLFNIISLEWLNWIYMQHLTYVTVYQKTEWQAVMQISLDLSKNKDDSHWWSMLGRNNCSHLISSSDKCTDSILF